VSETFSRSELLKPPGYEEESTNGSTPAAVETTNMSDAHSCAICHGPIPVDRSKNSTVCGNPDYREA
jgi:hypothetical protein